MPSITVKNIPDEVYEKIKERAESNRRSINSEIVFSLEKSVQADRVSEEEVLYQVRNFRTSISKGITENEINSAIKEGRE